MQDLMLDFPHSLSVVSSLLFLWFIILFRFGLLPKKFSDIKMCIYMFLVAVSISLVEHLLLGFMTHSFSVFIGLSFLFSGFVLIFFKPINDTMFDYLRSIFGGKWICFRWIPFIVLSFYLIFSLGYYTTLFIQDPDFASTVQTVWKLMIGEFPETTLFYKYYLSNHWMPILGCIAWVYKIFPYPWVMLVLSSLSCLFGLIGLRQLAYCITRSSIFSYVVCLSFVSHPLFGSAILGRVNTEVYLFSFLVWALYFGLTRRSFYSFLFIIFSWMCKEDAGLYTALIGCVLVWVLNDNSKKSMTRYGSFLVCVSLLFFVGINGWVMPLYKGIGTLGNIHWYAHLGDSFTDIIWRCFTNPGLLIRTLFTPDRAYGLFFLSLPIVGLIFRMGRFLWIPILPITIKLLSSNGDAFSFHKHHFWVPMLFLYVALIVGSGYLQNRKIISLERISISLTIVSLFFVCLSFSILIPKHVDSFHLFKEGLIIQKQLDDVKLGYGDSNYRVLGDSQVLAQLANRRYVYELNPYLKTTYVSYDDFRLSQIEQAIILERVNYIIFDRRKAIERNSNYFLNKLQVIERVKSDMNWSVLKDSDLLFVARKD